MKFFKLVFYKIFGLKAYLKLVSKVYIKYINNGFGKEKYPEIHYLKSIIKPGFTCIDIGANLGYYSYFMVKLAGKTGKVYAVEPIPLFSEIWKRNLQKLKTVNLKLFPFALGDSEKIVEMGMPAVDGVVHHGMTKVIDDEETNFEKKFSVEMKNPDILFENIEKVDFIKVDVEGYESEVFSNMIQTVIKHRPLIQSELSGVENRSKCISILAEIDYKPYILKNDELILADDNVVKDYNGDFYFLYEVR